MYFVYKYYNLSIFIKKNIYTYAFEVQIFTKLRTYFKDVLMLTNLLYINNFIFIDN